MKLAINILLVVAIVVMAIVFTIDFIKNRNVKTISAKELMRLRSNYYTTIMILLTLLLCNVLERIL